MNCPHRASTATKEQTKKTSLGYQTFRSSACRRIFNERTETPFNFLEYPTDIVLLVVFWRLRYKLSLRDLAEMFLERGFAFTRRAGPRVGGALCPLDSRSVTSQATRTSRNVLVCG
jgi:putative transposase